MESKFKNFEDQVDLTIALCRKAMNAKVRKQFDQWLNTELSGDLILSQLELINKILNYVNRMQGIKFLKSDKEN